MTLRLFFFQNMPNNNRNLFVFYYGLKGITSQLAEHLTVKFVLQISNNFRFVSFSRL